MQNPHCLLCLVCISLITSRAWWPCPPGRCCSPPPPPWSPSSAWSRQTVRVLSLGSRRSGWGTLQSIIPHSTTFLLIFTHSSTFSHIVQYSSNFFKVITSPFRRSECGRQSSVEVLSAPLAVTWSNYHYQSWSKERKTWKTCRSSTEEQLPMKSSTQEMPRISSLPEHGSFFVFCRLTNSFKQNVKHKFNCMYPATRKIIHINELLV